MRLSHFYVDIVMYRNCMYLAYFHMGLARSLARDARPRIQFYKSGLKLLSTEGAKQVCHISTDIKGIVFNLGVGCIDSGVRHMRHGASFSKMAHRNFCDAP